MLPASFFQNGSACLRQGEALDVNLDGSVCAISPSRFILPTRSRSPRQLSFAHLNASSKPPVFASNAHPSLLIDDWTFLSILMPTGLQV
ncbi:hypothetical protein VTH06DRAFT_3785 [Thermothelomyces fergusii]